MKRLLVFVFLAYGLSWLIWLPLYAPALGLPVFPLHHALGAFGPLIAALVVAPKSILPRIFNRSGWGYALLALLLPFVLGIIAAAVTQFFSAVPFRVPDFFSNTEFPSWSILPLFLYNVLFFGLGEEAGWRGFLLPELQKKFTAFNATLIVTVIWALWHWPLFLYRPGYMTMDIGGATGWLFSLLTGAVILTWMFNSSRGALWACIIFHATTDIVFTAKDALPLMNVIGMMITLFGLIILWRFGLKELSRLPRIRN